jgi:hypothetical protein
MNEQQNQNLDSLFKQVNDRLAIIGETPDAYLMMQLVEILKFEVAKNKSLEAQLTHVKRKQLLSTDVLKEIHHIQEFGLFCSFYEFEEIVRAIEHEYGIKQLPQSENKQSTKSTI